MKKQAFTLVELLVVIGILSVLSVIAFISLSGYSKEARDSKRISDTTNLFNKINVEQTRGKELSELVIDTKTKSGKILGELTDGIETFGVPNFQVLKEDSKSFKDPSNKTQDYLVSYSMGGTGTGSHNFLQIATVSEKDNTTKIIGKYYKLKSDDLDSLFLTGGMVYKEGDAPIYNIISGTSETPIETPVAEAVEIFGDEDSTAIAACNKWLQDNIGTKGGGYQNWLWVPASKFIKDGVTGIGMDDNYYKRAVTYNGVNYICKGFAVSRYEMTYDDATTPNSSGGDRNTYAYSGSKIPVSRSDRYPIGDIKQADAITSCNGIGIGFHLITNNEWMTIARNIELKASNWSSGTIGSGYISNGLSGNTTLGCVGANPKAIYTLLPRTQATKTGVGTDIGTSPECDAKRQLTLSNNEKIWDLAGNIWEHVNKGNTPTDGVNYNSDTVRISNACGGSNFYSFSGNDGVAQCGYINGYAYSNIGPSTAGLNSTNGIGRIYSYTTASNIFVRGGYSSSSPDAGIYSLHLYRSPLTVYKGIGFRCSL